MPRPSSRSRTCLFCPTLLRSGTRSREHVFPDWILQHFRIGDHVVTQRAWQGLEQSSPVRRHPLGAFRLGGVCEGCNKGWMSDLEQTVKPLLLALGKGDRRLPDLAHQEQRILSRWAVKTGLVLHAASNTRQVIPRSLYPMLRSSPKQLPPGLTVVATQTPDLDDDILAVTAFQSDRFFILCRPGTPHD